MKKRAHYVKDIQRLFQRKKVESKKLGARFYKRSLPHSIPRNVPFLQTRPIDQHSRNIEASCSVDRPSDDTAAKRSSFRKKFRKLIR